MTTLEKLMSLADEMANAADRNDSSAENIARQTLEAELRKLLTPLSDEQLYGMYSEPSSDAELLKFAREIEAAHGIPGDAK